MFGLGVSTSALMCGSPFLVFLHPLFTSHLFFLAQSAKTRGTAFLGGYDLIKPPAGREGQREKR